MSNYKGRTIIFLEGVYEKCSSANTFFLTYTSLQTYFLNIYVSANIFLNIYVSAPQTFFANMIFVQTIFFHFLTAIVESHFFKKYLAIFRFVICLKQSDHFLVPKVCQFLF